MALLVAATLVGRHFRIIDRGAGPPSAFETIAFSIFVLSLLLRVTGHPERRGRRQVELAKSALAASQPPPASS